MRAVYCASLASSPIGASEVSLLSPSPPCAAAASPAGSASEEVQRVYITFISMPVWIRVFGMMFELTKLSRSNCMMSVESL